MENNILNINLWGTRIGSIYWDRSNPRWAHSILSFDEGYLNSGLNIAPTEFPSKLLEIRGELPVASQEKEFKCLPRFLYDSLPDDWGNSVIRRWAEKNKISFRHISPVDMLSYIGKRGMGALEYEPSSYEPKGPDSISLSSLYELARRIFDERESETAEALDAMSMEDLFRVGTSAGGRRPKAVIAISDKTGEVRSGQASLPQEYRHYIIKFDEKSDFPRTRVEMAYYLMAVDAGIEMMPCRLMEIEGSTNFMTERYDRKNGEKLHTQSLLALTKGSDSYESLFSTARTLMIPYEEVSQLFRRAVFNVLACNVDDHDKNFSFMMGRDGKWHSTPAYDLVYSIDENNSLTGDWHEMRINGKRKDITEDDLLLLAEDNDIKNGEKIISEVKEAIQNFDEYAAKASVGEKWTSRIKERLLPHKG